MNELETLCRSVKPTRWADLLEHLEWFAAHERHSPADRSRLIEDVESRISHWGTEERLAPEAWLYDIATEDIWEYGVSGVHSEEYFHGFASQPHWLFPLATSVCLTDHRVNLCWDNHVAQFKTIDCWNAIRHLSIAIPMSEDCKNFIATDPRFRGMQVTF